jgi:hypothetical protein
MAVPDGTDDLKMGLGDKHEDVSFVRLTGQRMHALQHDGALPQAGGHGLSDHAARSSLELTIDTTRGGSSALREGSLSHSTPPSTYTSRGAIQASRCRVQGRAGDSGPRPLEHAWLMPPDVAWSVVFAWHRVVNQYHGWTHRTAPKTASKRLEAVQSLHVRALPLRSQQQLASACSTSAARLLLLENLAHDAELRLLNKYQALVHRVRCCRILALLQPMLCVVEMQSCVQLLLTLPFAHTQSCRHQLVSVACCVPVSSS